MSESPGRFRVSLPLRSRDVDVLGHVNQAVYHELLEDARVGYLEPVMVRAGESFVLARVELDYRREVTLDAGHVDVVVGVAEVGTRSVTLANDVLLPDGTVAASGRAIVVAWDQAGRCSRELRAEELATLAAMRDAAGDPVQP